MNKLVRVGGDDLGVAVRGMWREILTDKAGCFFSWAGQTGKVALKNSPAFDLVWGKFNLI